MSRFDLDKKVSLRLDGRLCEKLQDYADRERVPVAYVLRHLVIRFFDGKPQVTDSFLGPAPDRRSSGVVQPSQVERLQADFAEKVCCLFDGFRRQGLDVKEATKRTNFALKAKNEPWATYEVVASVLRAAGRFRKQKGVRTCAS